MRLRELANASNGESAIDEYRLSGDETRFVATQPCDDTAQVLLIRMLAL